MTKEEAIEILENGDFWDLCVAPYVYSNRPAMEFQEALDMAIAALRAQQKLLEMLELDRDAWKLCDGCRPNRFFGNRFCCRCGRPLTEGAWAELERRIGGSDGTTD